MFNRALSLTCIFGTACILGCGSELPDPDYPDFTDALAGIEETSTFVEPPNPFIPGSNRLSIGIFYDGPYSDIILLDDTTTHFYIYEGTFDIKNEYQLVREGLRADAIIGVGTPWLGGGVSWDEAKDLSDWSTMHVSLRSDSAQFNDIKLEIEAGRVLRVELSEYGFVADGEWHELTIPLESLRDRGADLSAVTRPFVLIGGNISVGTRLIVDNLYFE